jgi:GTP diphosphokinase / guanosine-3',5'-bis(diphosphate) 3'-diphosphatase
VIRQYELVERVRAYDPDVDEDVLNRAYVFSMKVHGAQKRASGDPYFLHPLEVAGILTRYRLDAQTIATALLHDTVEDTLTTVDEIEKIFGPDIGRLVDGVTKLSRIELQSDQTKQAENFRKLLLAMSADIRVLLVKLADRLHNMRTIGYIQSAEKRQRIARETMEIYAPLAERIGMRQIQEELEDLAFAQMNPDARASIVTRLEFLRARGSDLVARIVDRLKRVLGEDGMEVSVSGREKSPYSIWRKMQRKNVGFEQLSDIMAFRVVVGGVPECYRALGLIHGRYPLVPGRFKDYVSTPKPNGYRSLHTSVIGPEQQRIEIQIRTRDMHDVAEYGVAAHWSYKDGRPGSAEGNSYRWLRELLELLENASDPQEFLEHTKLELFQDQVFCFTPKGALISLPRGATIVDFAYAVHSEVGDRCVGGKVNGRMMPLRTQLANGDQVDVITSKAQTPSPLWERFVVTGKARARIRRFIRSQQRSQFAALGRSMLQKAFQAEGYEFADKAVDNVLRGFKCQSAEDLFALIGEGEIAERQVLGAIFPGSRPAAGEAPPRPADAAKRARAAGSASTGISIKGLIPGMAVHYAECCHPLPGDRIVGIVVPGRGAVIHTIDCDALSELGEQPERWIDVSWDAGADGPDLKVGRIRVVVANEPGSLGALSTVIARNEGNISNLKIVNRTAQFWEMMIDIEVRNVKHLTNVIAALRATPSINGVERVRG